ncbi:MAG: hypothetical protein ABIW76_00555, partial [Fibrobacteria bacterium]
NWKQLVSSSVIRQPAHPRLILRNGKLRMAGSLETDPLRFYDAMGERIAEPTGFSGALFGLPGPSHPQIP